MFRLSYAHLWVNDQDESLAFYTEKVGMELRADVTLSEMGGFRWVVVGAPGQPDVGITLMSMSNHPMIDQETGDQLRAVVSKGFGGTVFLTTDDCRAEHRRLVERGVEFVEEPEERPYGIDAGFRDPSGNHLRLTQETAMAG